VLWGKNKLFENHCSKQEKLKRKLEMQQVLPCSTRSVRNREGWEIYLMSKAEFSLPSISTIVTGYFHIV